MNDVLISFVFVFSLIEAAVGEMIVTRDPVVMFLAGDVMTGRGIDQALPHPGDPTLYEPYVKDARDYVTLAEQLNGPIQQPVQCAAIWGDALQELKRFQPDVRLINLETTITTSNDFWQGKGIHYKMHPLNVSCLTAARIDHCSLANNHILDWGYAGLTETLVTLNKAGINVSGAGQDLLQAGNPAIMALNDNRRVVIFSYGLRSSGIPNQWAAREDRPGVNFLLRLSGNTIQHIKRKVDTIKQPGDIVIASIHWGGNWGYDIPGDHIKFAHQLIDEAGVDIIHGHSSHHARPLEVYHGKLILYGSGDFLNDYEGIKGYEDYRDDLTLMYFASVDPISGKLIQLHMVPMQIKQFRLSRASEDDALWLKNTLNRESQRFGTQIQLIDNQILTVRID